MIDPRLLAHPLVREEAARLARETWEATNPAYPGHVSGPDAAPTFWTASFVHLLADPDRPASRDALVRIGFAADVVDPARCPQCQGSGEYDADYDGDMPIIRKCGHDARYYWRKWDNLRDRPGNLVTAILELSPVTP